MKYKYSSRVFQFAEHNILQSVLTISFLLLIFACKKNKSANSENIISEPIAKEISTGVINKDSIAVGDTGYYKVKLVPGKTYAFLLIDLNGSNGSMTIYTDKSFQTIIAENQAPTSPKEVQLWCSANVYFIKVYNTNTGGKRLYHILILEVTSQLVFTNEGALGQAGNPQSIPLIVNSIRFSQVGTRSSSYYSISKKNTGTFTFCIVGLTSDANLRIFPDETYTMETDCTLLRPPNAGNEPQQCTYPSNKDYYIRVDEGGLNRNGVGFYLIAFYQE